MLGMLMLWVWYSLEPCQFWRLGVGVWRRVIADKVAQCGCQEAGPCFSSVRPEVRYIIMFCCCQFKVPFLGGCSVARIIILLSSLLRHLLSRASQVRASGQPRNQRRGAGRCEKKCDRTWRQRVRTMPTTRNRLISRHHTVWNRDVSLKVVFSCFESERVESAHVYCTNCCHVPYVEKKAFTVD